jgi:DNA-directed RNA polymerase specialized sigma subunit
VPSNGRLSGFIQANFGQTPQVFQGVRPVGANPTFTLASNVRVDMQYTPSDFPAGWRVPSSKLGKHELMLWWRWKERGETPQDMAELLQSLQPLIHKRLQEFSGVPIHAEALHSEAVRRVIDGLRHFDPHMAQMNTHLTNVLKGMKRYVVSNQNLSRIVEERANKIGPYQRAHAELAESLGREPTATEIAELMQVPVNTVIRLQLEVRQDLLASGALEDPFLTETPRAREVIRLVVYELTPTEMQVYEYLVGINGKPKITQPGDIAKRLKWSSSKVSQVKASIAAKIQKHM